MTLADVGHTVATGGTDSRDVTLLAENQWVREQTGAPEKVEDTHRILETIPLQRSRRLAEAAAERLVLTSKELSEVLGHSVSSWRNSREDYGFRFRRYKQQGKVLWSVECSLLLPG